MEAGLEELNLAVLDAPDGVGVDVDAKAGPDVGVCEEEGLELKLGRALRGGRVWVVTGLSLVLVVAAGDSLDFEVFRSGEDLHLLGLGLC